VTLNEVGMSKSLFNPISTVGEKDSDMKCISGYQYLHNTSPSQQSVPHAAHAYNQ
jgi:hypothetical protein